MAINLVVAVTDYDWFQALRVREDWPEVNFWAPSGANFRALQPRELFLFELHARRNYIVGGGVFAHSIHCRARWPGKPLGKQTALPTLRRCGLE